MTASVEQNITSVSDPVIARHFSDGLRAFADSIPRVSPTEK